MLNLADVNLLQANQVFKCPQRSFQILQITVIGQWLHLQMFLGSNYTLRRKRSARQTGCLLHSHVAICFANSKRCALLLASRAVAAQPAR